MAHWLEAAGAMQRNTVPAQHHWVPKWSLAEGFQKGIMLQVT